MDIPKLHPETVEAVRQRMDIVDVVSEHVVLKKRGKDYVGLCPFHQESTPSFTVNTAKQMYYCFGCKAGGDALQFIKEIGKQSFAEAVVSLAQKYQVPIQAVAPSKGLDFQRQLSLRQQLYEVLAIATSFFQHALYHFPAAKEYLTTDRGIPEGVIQQFKLGYAPDTWDTLYGYLVNQRKYPAILVEQAGLISAKKSGGYVDRFRNRIMVPICDPNGRVIGFGGRSLANEQPKYLNTPETELFNKSKTLFALDQAKGSISRDDYAIVVEGYFDAIALHGAGISQAVASMGTSLTEDQVKLLLRYTASKQVMINFDADQAGVNSVGRVIEAIAPLVYSGQVNIRVISLPDGKDADEFLKHRTIADYQELIKQAPLWLDWRLDQLISGVNLKQADQFQRVSSEMVAILKQMTDSNQRNYYIQRCADLLSLGDLKLFAINLENLITQVNPSRQDKDKPVIRKPQIKVVTTPKSSTDALLEKAEATLLRIYLHCPEYRDVVDTVLEERDLMFCISPYRLLWQQIKILETQFQEADLTSVIQQHYLSSEELANKLEQIIHLFHLEEMHQQDMAAAADLINACAACMERVVYERCCQYYLGKWKQTSPSDRALLEKYFHELSRAKAKVKELDQELQFLYFYR